MERKDLIFTCVLIIVILAVACAVAVYFDSLEDTNLSLKESSVYKNDKITFTLTDSHGNPLSNESISVNIQDKYYDLVTNSKGIAKLKIKLSKGNYNIEAKFEGNGNLKSSELNETLKVKVKPKPKPKSTPKSVHGSYTTHVGGDGTGYYKVYEDGYTEYYSDYYGFSGGGYGYI